MKQEPTPLQRMLGIHEGFLHHAKVIRINLKQGKHVQESIERSLARHYGYEKHGGFWIQMEKTEDGLKLPAYVAEAAKMIEALPESQLTT